MPVAAPNQTRLKITAGVLRLERFTVADLCAHTGLLPSMVYRELSELQQEKILESKSATAEGEKAPRHRPRKWYELSSDPRIRARLESELASFLPEYEEPTANRHLKKAQELVTELGAETVTPSLRSLDEDKLNVWETNLRRRFEEAQAELKRATWESEIDFSEGDHSDHPIQVTRRTWESLQVRFSELLREERKRRLSEAARKSWGEILTSSLRSVIPTLPLTPEFPALTITLAEVAAHTLAPKVSEVLYKRLRAWAEKRDQSPPTGYYLPFVSSFELDLKEAQSESEQVAAIAKHAISYGNSPDEPLACIRILVAKCEDDYRLLFDEANLAQLAQRPDEARQSWTRYLDKKQTLAEPKKATPVIARIEGKLWSEHAYDNAVHAITTQCQAAVTVISESPFESGEEYEIEPQVYNPVPEKSVRGNLLIRIADPLAQNKRLYVKTTEAERPLMLGLPTLAMADVFSVRICMEDAWNLATAVKPDERIVKVDFFRNATAAARAHAEEILTSTFSARLIR